MLSSLNSTVAYSTQCWKDMFTSERRLAPHLQKTGLFYRYAAGSPCCMHLPSILPTSAFPQILSHCNQCWIVWLETVPSKYLGNHSKRCNLENVHWLRPENQQFSLWITTLLVYGGSGNFTYLYTDMGSRWCFRLVYRRSEHNYIESPDSGQPCIIFS